MSRPEFENQTLISAVTNKSIVCIQGYSDASIPNGGGAERITIRSPEGTISKLFNIKLTWNGEATGSGTKNLILDQEKDDVSGIGLFQIVGGFGSLVGWDQGTFLNATTKSPDDLSAMSNQINAGRFDETKGLQLVFANNMGGTATARRNWVLFVEREVVGR